MTPHLCPPWCVHPVPHDEDRGGYFHDSEPVSLPLAAPDDGDPDPHDTVLSVTVSQFVGPRGGIRPVKVSLQDQYATVGKLTSREARELAGMLSSAADRADGGKR